MMKRTLSILALVLIFCLTAACGAEDVLSQMTDGQSETSAAGTASGTDADAAAEPDQPVSEDTPTDADTQSQTNSQPQGELSAADLVEGSTDFAALPPEECVEDALPDPGVLPRIALDCPGAQTINQAIQDAFFSVSEDPMCQLHYECGKGAGRVLSIVMVKQVDDWSEHTVYNLDLTTGQALSPEELLSLLELDENELANLELAVLGEEFTHQFGGMQAQTDQEFYDQQYARTTSADNAELEKLWFSGDGQLCFAGRVYPLAGAEYYEYQLSTGMVF